MTVYEDCWRPLNEREAGLVDERPFVEGTPDYLLEPLRGWVDTAFKLPNILTAVGLVLRRSLPGPGHPQVSPALYLGGEELLDVIDAVLHVQRFLVDSDEAYLQKNRVGWLKHVANLKFTLWQGSSVWEVDQAFTGLERRVDETVAAAYQHAEKIAEPTAAAHLAMAWKAAKQRNPDPTRAYSEAIKAVEAVAIPIVLPTDNLATLGKVRGAMRQSSWELAVAGKTGAPASASAVIEMISLLWDGQRDRHAGSPTSGPVTQEAAEMAVQSAVVLVTWFSTGAIRRP